MSALTITQKSFDPASRTVTLVLTGVMDKESISQLIAAFQEVQAKKIRNIILSCAELKRLNSTGLAYLLQLKESMEKAGGRFAISSLQGPLTDIIKLMHFDQLIAVVPTDQEALRWVQSDKDIPEQIETSGLFPVLSVNSSQGFTVPGIVVRNIKREGNDLLQGPYGEWRSFFVHREPLRAKDRHRYVYLMQRHIKLFPFPPQELWNIASKNMQNWYRTSPIKMEEMPIPNKCPMLAVKLPKVQIAASVVFLPEFHAAVQDRLGGLPTFSLPNRFMILAFLDEHFEGASPTPAQMAQMMFDKSDKDIRLSPTLFTVTGEGASVRT